MGNLKQTGANIAHSIPSLLWLVFVWCALWRDFSVPNLAFGLVLGILTLSVFRLPTLFLSNRINLWYSLVFLGYFIAQIAVASFQLLWVSATFRPPLDNSIISVKLRTRSDLLLTATSHTLSLIPGSLVVDVDRANSTIFFHVINASSKREVARFRKQALDVEAMIIRAAGTREEYEALRREELHEADLRARGEHQ